MERTALAGFEPRRVIVPTPAGPWPITVAVIERIEDDVAELLEAADIVRGAFGVEDEPVAKVNKG
jgi:hypothetical protein